MFHFADKLTHRLVSQVIGRVPHLQATRLQATVHVLSDNSAYFHLAYIHITTILHLETKKTKV